MSNRRKFSAEFKASGCGVGDFLGPVEWAKYRLRQTENIELKREIDFLGKVSAFFAAKQR